MDKLKPCPFCGGEARLESDYSSELDKTRWSVWHECCEHEGESAGYGHALFPWYETPWYATEAEAIAAWNTRAERTCEVLGEDYDELLEYWETELSCGHVYNGMASYVDYCPKCGAKVVEK